MTHRIGHQRGQGRWAIAVIAAALCGALSAVPLTASAAPDSGAGISVNLAGKTTGDMTTHFMGLSFESTTLNNGYRYDNVGNLPQLLKNLGSGVIRFGGNSADTGFTGVTQAEAASVGRLTKATGWRVIYSESLLHFNAKADAADAKVVHDALGGYLDAFACGNEPDQYSADHVKPASYNVGSHVSAVNACYNAIRAGAKGAPVEGPDIAWNPSWLSGYAAKDKGTASFFGAHYYPLGCAKSGESASAAVTTLMSAGLASAEAKRLTTDEAIARQAGRPLRITETNSACAGGVKGASNTYATALWVIDYMLTGAKLGVAGMNFHGGLNTLCGGYTVLCGIGQNQYVPQPIYYGMLFSRLFGTGGFLPVTLSTAATARHVVAFADKGSKDRVMLEDMGSQAAPVTLHLNGYKGTSVQVLHMTGSSLTATSGVKIQGASVAANGTLTPGSPDTVSCRLATCSLTLAPYSAALVTL